jgi:uracil phosphoribosyltransferase
MTAALHVVDHALLAHRMAELRDVATPSPRFRRLLAEIGAMLTVEATRNLPSVIAKVTTPLTTMDHQKLAGPEPVLVAVLRAGLGLLEGGMQILPEAPVGHVGLARDEHTLQPSQYLLRMPPEVTTRGAILYDPMLATGGSAIAAVSRVKESGAKTIRFVCVVAAPEGVAKLREAHPDVPIYTAALDVKLNERGFIVPGLGDAGDRCFGTEG